MSVERTVFLARHGNRQDFVDRSWGRTARLPDDPPLSEDGRVQARELGERLRSEQIAHVFASPFARTVETASIVADRLDLPVKIERGLSEWLNPAWFEGPPELTPAAELLASFPRIDAAYRSRVLPRHPETVSEMRARVSRAVRALVADWAGTLLFVGHGASVDAAAWSLAGEGWVVQSSLCAIVKLELDGGRWRVVLNGDTAHLSRPELAPAPRIPPG